MNLDKKKNFIINTVFYTIIIALIIAIIKYLLPILLPFIISFIMASVLAIPARKLSGNDSRVRRICAILMGILFFSLLFLGIAIMGVKVYDWFLGFLEFVPRIYQEEILPLLNNFYGMITTQFDFADVENVEK